MLGQPRYTQKQVADFCAVSERTVRKWDKEGLLKFQRVSNSNRKYVDHETLLKFLNEHEQPIPEEFETEEKTMAEPFLSTFPVEPMDDKELVTQEVTTDEKELVTQEVQCDNEKCDCDGGECDQECD